jgi:hypothetical protein
MPLRVKIGDIIEIPTSKGLAYAQYTHKHHQWGALIRVLDGIYKTRPSNFAELVKKQHRFVTFFPLGAAVNRKIFEVVGHAEVPEEAAKFPLFRAGNADKNWKVAVWWLWDGEKSWPVGQLTPEEYKLPIQEIPNDTALVNEIEKGWTPENDRRR